MIQLDLKKMENHIQRVPVDKIQFDLEEVSAQVQRDLHDLIDELLFKPPKLEEKAALILCDPEVKPATPHHDLVECPLSISLENFVLHKVLGEGSFGKIILAELKESGEFFAIKALNKSSVLTNGYAEYTMIEKRVLKLAVENPFLAHLHSTFQTKARHLYSTSQSKMTPLITHLNITC
ncbi:hypothetical protein AAFF_G00130240 [Aldrovandia affinis]|uniref:non-specific serine/threonine protein kinase n=1 Tax=Aldrovandia affinis TaxID=143900 RepID=A0AAD7RTM7_9TELE|nr:hypothetical protein AAFF_G00130240 [Aldrovandia affinis]